jgi:hypothetical protein
MDKIKNSKHYDLEDRTLKFAERIRIFIKKIPKSIENIEDGKQLIKESTELMMIFSSIMIKSIQKNEK